MTMNPGTPPPESNPPITATPPANGADDGTFHQTREPRGEARLPLGDGVCHQLARAYVRVRMISTGALLLFLLVVAPLLQLCLSQMWVWIPAAVFTLISRRTLDRQTAFPRQRL